MYSVIIPEAGQNLHANPSFEKNLTGWSAMAGVLTRSAEQQKFGAYSGKCVPTAAVNDGCYYGTVNLVNGTNYLRAVYVRFAVGIPYQAYIATSAGVLVGAAVTGVGTGDWQRVLVPYLETASLARRLYVTKNNSASVAPFYVDGDDIQAKTYETTYTDGSLPGHTWDGLPHNSSSTRGAAVRSGGRKIDLETADTWITFSAGRGMPPVANSITPYGQGDGAYFNNASLLARTFILNVQALGDSLIGLQAIRQVLIAALDPRKTVVQQPVRIYYSGNTKEIYLNCYYDGGLEGSAAVGYAENISVRFIAPDPNWYEDQDDGAALTVQASIVSQSRGHLLAKGLTGAWIDDGVGNAASGIFCHALGPDGCVYVGGDFTSMGGVANTARLAKWDGLQWLSVTGAAFPSSGAVNAIAFTSNGDLYIGGSFASMTAIANSAFVAKIDSAGVVTGLNAGGVILAAITCLLVPPTGATLTSGYVILAGGLNIMTDGAGFFGVVKWSGAAWAGIIRVGGGGGNYPRSLAMNLAGSILYTAASGSATFALAGGGGSISSIMLASFDGTTLVDLNLTGGQANALLTSKDGYIYAGGAFLTANGVTGTKGIARWTGTVWQSLGGGFAWTAGNVWSLFFDPAGLLWIAGTALTSGGGYTLYGLGSLAIWNGSSFLPADIDVGVAFNNPIQVLVTPTGVVYLSFAATDANPYISNAVTTLTNHGTARAYPQVRIVGPGKLWELANATSGDKFIFNYTLVAGEVLLIDLRPGGVAVVSELSGVQVQAIQPGSTMGAFELMPGDNAISLLIADATAAAAVWMNRAYESADGAA